MICDDRRRLRFRETARALRQNLLARGRARKRVEHRSENCISLAVNGALGISDRCRHSGCYDDLMPPQDASRPDEIPREAVEIRQDAAITIQDALLIAAEQACPIGKSTLQRWAKVWAERGAASAVKSVLVTNRAGSFYRIDREDFKAWLFDQTQNMRPGEAPRDPAMSHETSRDTARPQQTSRGAERPHEASGADLYSDAMQTMRDENMQLRIDVEVRKQLLNQAAGEITRQRDHIEGLLRENGALQSRVLQLSAPARQERQDLPPAAEHAYETGHYSQHKSDDTAAAAGAEL